MKILILANHAYVVYKFRKELLINLLEDGHKVFISCPYDNILDNLLARGITLLPLNFDRHSLNPLGELKIVLHYYKIIRHINPDIVLTYTIKPNIYGSIISSVLKKSYICTITGLGTVFDQCFFITFIVQVMYKIALKHAKKVCFQNKDNLNFMLRKGIIKDNYVLVNGSGVNLKQFSYIPYPSEKKEITFLFVGRLMKEKGIIEFCEAAKVLLQYGYFNTKFQVIGFCEDIFKKKLESLELSQNISFLGVQSNVRNHIALAHAVVLPSYQEGMSNALLEAAACGRPLIASDIPGCREIIDNNDTGFLIKPRNVDSLVEALIVFMKLSHEKKRLMGLKGRKKVEETFNRDIVVNKYKEIIYKEMV
ncbi:glycosyltransferase family 4 protein [Cloacibacillus porcorum]